MRMRRFVLSAAACLACLALVVGLECGGSEVVGYHGGSEVVGTAVDSLGTPISHATVIALKQIDTTFVKVDSVSSDPNGQFTFTFTASDSGTYRIIGKKDSLLGILNDVKNDQFAPDKQRPIRVDVGKLKLVPPGTISGRVIIYGDDMAGVECYVPGIAMTATAPDGSFKLQVPPGTYCIYFHHDGYATAKDTPVIAVSNSVTQLPLLTLQLNGSAQLPAPRGLGYSYDTLRGTVKLWWRSIPAPGIIKQYVVYRSDSGSTSKDSAVIAPSDTVFCDTVFRDLSSTTPRTLEYQVRAVDVGNNPGLNSMIVEVAAVPPFTVRPVFGYVPDTLVVPFNGTAVCSVSVKSSLDTYKVFMDFDGSGAAYGWIEVPHSADGIARTTFATGNKSAWGRVAVKLAFGTDSAMAGFTVHIRPRAVNIVAADSTDSCVTVKWNQSPDSDFLQYAVHRTAQGRDSVLYHLSRADTVFTFKTWSHVASSYSVTIVDTEGETSLPGAARNAAIVNSPPRFTTDPATLPPSASVETDYRLPLAATDKNGDSLSYTRLSPLPVADLGGSVFSWTPVISQAGAQTCSVVVRDGHGGADTLSWKVNVSASGVWVDGDSMRSARCSFGTAVVNGKIYVIGGRILKLGKLAVAKTVEVYDTAKHQWDTTRSLGTARHSPMVAVAGEKIYVLGGFDALGSPINTIEQYDPATNTWTPFGQMPFARGGGAACAVGDKLYCVGGSEYNSAIGEFVARKSIDIFNVKTAAWSKGPLLGYARADHQVVASRGKIYVFGGAGGIDDSVANSEQTVLQNVEAFDTLGTSSNDVTSLLSPRFQFAAATLGNILYIMGGMRDDIGQILPGMETFNVATLESTNLSASLPMPRFGAQAVGLNGRIYYMGGLVGTGTSSATKSVIVYYP